MSDDKILEEEREFLQQNTLTLFEATPVDGEPCPIASDPPEPYAWMPVDWTTFRVTHPLNSGLAVGDEVQALMRDSDGDPRPELWNLGIAAGEVGILVLRPTDPQIEFACGEQTVAVLEYFRFNDEFYSRLNLPAVEVQEILSSTPNLDVPGPIGRTIFLQEIPCLDPEC